MSSDGRQLNALKHGAFARDVVLPGESREEFEELYRSLLDDVQAEGRFEEETTLSIAKLQWAEQRLERWTRAKVDELRVEHGMKSLQRVASFDSNPALRAYARPTQEDLADAISSCPEPYCSLIKKELRAELSSNTSWDDYAETARNCAANLLVRFRKEVEAEPNSTEYQQSILSKIEAIQAEQIIAAERLGAMVDRLFKRLLQTKAYKQVLARQLDAQKTIEAAPNERKPGTQAD